VVRYTLTHPLPSLFDKIEPLLAKCMGPIEHMGSRSLLPEATMDWLLSREDERVRLSAALAEFRGDSKGHVRESVKTAWRAAIVEGIASKKSARDLRMIYDLCKMLDYDRTLAFDILSKMIDNDHTSMWDLEPLQPIVAVLSAGEKSTLLSKCGSLRVTDFVAVLVGDDLGLYQQLLATGELRDHHLKPLIGNPTHPPWIAKALMALHAGYSAAEISRSVLGWHWGGTGPESTMWQKWIDKFQPLLGHSNPQIREIGEAGIEWSTRDRDRALKRERHAEVHGYFNET